MPQPLKHQELLEQLDYAPLTGIFTWKVTRHRIKARYTAGLRSLVQKMTLPVVKQCELCGSTEHTELEHRATNPNPCVNDPHKACKDPYRCQTAGSCQHY